ncbi:MAG TPA: hypothetical protein VFA70_07635 [Dehalococcoidia bacterium]|jgi:hypothetical protein|nr:hypothetical protein [Dehalococcoidia bacterium]
MSEPGVTQADRYATVVAELCHRHARVEAGSDGKRGFGSAALKAHGKIFAMLDSRGEFVVKLPRQRVEALIASGLGQSFHAGKGRPLKEWVTVTNRSLEVWLVLADEALAYVSPGV